MLPVFILALMTVLALSTLIAVFTNSLIIVVNLIDKAKGKHFSPSDLIVVTLCISNIIFQFTMLINDYMSFIESDVYFTDEVYTVSVVFLILPIYSSFWFTVCLSINYYLQIVISTHPVLIRLKLAGSQLIPPLIMASLFISLATGLPAAWNIYRDPLELNISNNESEEASYPKLSTAYLLPSNLVSCSLPLVLVGVANGLIIKSLVTKTHKSDRNAKGEMSARAEGRVRAARTISCLLILYISFYVAEILVFIEVFPQSSPEFCACLVVIYGYSPAQSIVLIFGSPKLKQVFVTIFLYCTGGINKGKPRTPTVLFIKLKEKKNVHFPKE
ncbi:PREDICTED: taste receptor type 2 member 9-like [Nanorana parkeri]|uniref:taste receptor type 2 member 9-like n=1 Tax=Nanorana parkeri TaxID=125878 RepID=UPI000854D88B|nr:PREDICTED: taste receptor type 2 member 9-like [Nanorana parkeri]